MAFNEWQGSLNTAWTVEEDGQPYAHAFVGGDQDHSWAAPVAEWGSYYGNSKGNRSHGHPLSQMSAQVPSVKQPPVFHVGMAWFKYEQLVRHWAIIADVDAKKQGTFLNMSLVNDLEIYKEYLDDSRLREAEGTDYFLRTLKPHFVKGDVQVFMHHFMELNA